MHQPLVGRIYDRIHRLARDISHQHLDHLPAGEKMPLVHAGIVPYSNQPHRVRV
jgi:hypothetical protein